MISGKQLVLRRSLAHHGRCSRARRALFREEGWGTASPRSCFRSGKRTNSKWVRSSTFQVTVSPDSRSKAEAKGRGMLAYTCTVPP
jgi:hypothetical protein